MDATCTIQDSIHVFNLVHKYVSRILGTYQFIGGIFLILKNPPNQLAIYILLLGRKSQRKRISPTHILYIIHKYTKYAT